MVRSGHEPVVPVINLLRDEMLANGYSHMDETTVQVPDEPGRAAQDNFFMWCQVSGTRERPVVLFDYDPSRYAGRPGVVKRLVAQAGLE